MGRAFYYGGLDSLVRVPGIKEMIPSSGLFRSYVSRAQRLTDAPSVYHIGALLGIFAAVVSPYSRLLFKRGSMTRREPMHLWVMLCGRSNNRKSYSIDLTTAALEPWIRDRLCPDSGTREGFEEFMIAHPNACFAIREAPTWLADNRTVWMRNGAAWWCKIFDGKLEPKLKRSDDDGGQPIKTVHDVMVCVTGAGETTAVVAASRPTDWTGGMFSRMLFLAAGKRKESDEWYDWPDEDLKRIRSSVQSALRLAKRSRGVSISPQAWSVYRAWNGPLQESADGLPLAQSTILGRLGRHIKVVSALYALSCGKTEVDAECMRAATKLGQYSHKTVMELPI